MKLRDLIIELEKLDLQGKGDYEVKIVFWSDEGILEDVLYNDVSKEIIL